MGKLAATSCSAQSAMAETAFVAMYILLSALQIHFTKNEDLPRAETLSRLNWKLTTGASALVAPLVLPPHTLLHNQTTPVFSYLRGCAKFWHLVSPHAHKERVCFLRKTLQFAACTEKAENNFGNESSRMRQITKGSRLNSIIKHHTENRFKLVQTQFDSYLAKIRRYRENFFVMTNNDFLCLDTSKLCLNSLTSVCNLGLGCFHNSRPIQFNHTRTKWSSSVHASFTVYINGMGHPDEDHPYRGGRLFNISSLAAGHLDERL